jgi:hypothetical protein
MLRVRGVSGGGWKGEAVRRGVKISDEEDDLDHGSADGMSFDISGSVMRR